MLSVGESSAIQIVDQRTRSLIAALSAAIYCAYILLSIVIHCLNSLLEILCCPCTRCLVKILKCASRLKNISVDRHRMCCHTKRILIEYTIVALACTLYRIINQRLCFVCPQIAQIYHQTLCAPVSHQTFWSFQHKIRRLFALDGRVDLVIAICIIQILYRHMDIRIHCIEIRDHAVNCF